MVKTKKKPIFILTKDWKKNLVRDLGHSVPGSEKRYRIKNIEAFLKDGTAIIKR